MWVSPQEREREREERKRRVVEGVGPTGGDYEDENSPRDGDGFGVFDFAGMVMIMIMRGCAVHAFPLVPRYGLTRTIESFLF